MAEAEDGWDVQRYSNKEKVAGEMGAGVRM